MTNPTPTTAASSTNGRVVRCDPPAQPVDNAQRFIDAVFSTLDGRRTLIFHRDDFYRWHDTHWARVEQGTVRAILTEFFHHAAYWKTSATGALTLEPFNPTHAKNRDLLSALQDLTHLAGTDLPSWLSDDLKIADRSISASTIVPLRNGLFDVATRTLYAPTTRFFNLHACDYDYDAYAPSLIEWPSFVMSMFGDDLERIHLLQEWMGYLLTTDTSRQKMLAFIGLPGSGKGTLLRVITHLLGADTVGSIGIAGLGEPHGLEHIVDKRLVTLTDVQSVGRNADVAVERLAAISGQDKISVNPKNKRQYDTFASCRFMMAANRVPNLPDRDGALQRRLLVLKFTRSFADRPDDRLLDRLLTELPAIFNWALEGLDRLRARGRFVQPEVGKEELQLLASGAAPEHEFAIECCVAGPDRLEAKDDLFEAWETWRRKNGYAMRSRSTFLRALYSAYPHLDGRQRTSNDDVRGARRVAISGLQLTEDAKTRYLVSSWV